MNNKINIQKILKLHKLWLKGSKKGIKADLSGANFSLANLSGADFSLADLSGADLSGADLSRTNLSGADLSGADLSGAKLSGADLSSEEWNKLKSKFTIATGDTKYVYKKLQNNIIAHLEIPPEAKRSNAFSRKCRAERVKVIKLLDEYDNEVKEGLSCYDPTFKYEVGKIVAPKEPFDDRWYNECGSGIHFFLTEQEAKEFV